MREWLPPSAAELYIRTYVRYLAAQAGNVRWSVRRMGDGLADDRPEPFLEVLVQDLDLAPTLTALCAGFEQGEWRSEGFARHLFEWLPEFALSREERASFSSGKMVELVRRAAQVVYSSEKYQRRGEFGELILHAVARQVFGSEPAISKIYYKDSANDTVKGFDAVHVVGHDDELELWLGEAKFYGSITGAISAVVDELRKHMEKDYLRSEFALITNKVDDSWPLADRFKRLLHPNTSLDEVFTRVRIPVLLTYDSRTVQSFSESSSDYREAFGKEVKAAHASFSSNELPPVLIHLLLVPLKNKVELRDALDAQLRVWQQL